MAITERPPAEQTPARLDERPSRVSMPNIVGGAVLVLIGVLWLLERVGLIDVSVTAVLALATMAIGVSLILLARFGPHRGLIVFGTSLALITVLTAAAPFEGFQGGVGDRAIEVSSVADIENDYNLAMGKLTIDLRQVEDLGQETFLSASVGIGELLVRVAPGTEVLVVASVGVGQVELLGRTTDGLGIDEKYESPGFADSSERLVLELQTFTGRVEVTNE